MLWLEGWDDVSHVLKSHRDLAVPRAGGTWCNTTTACAAPALPLGACSVLLHGGIQLSRWGEAAWDHSAAVGLPSAAGGARCAEGVRRRRSDVGSARSAAAMAQGDREVLWDGNGWKGRVDGNQRQKTTLNCKPVFTAVAGAHYSFVFHKRNTNP